MANFGKSKYFDIKQLLEQEIISGKFPPGSLLPSEPKLAEIYNASRGTIRQALSALEREAIIARRSGIGTMVVRNPGQKTIASFTDQVVKMGNQPSAKVMNISTLPVTQASERCREAFFFPGEQNETQTVYCIERLRLADNIPVAFHRVYLKTSDFGPKFIDEDFSVSIYSIYRRYQKRLIWADEIIQARPANDHEIELFNLSEMPLSQRLVYVRDRITYNEENLAVEVLNSIERWDFFGSYRYRLMIQE